MYRSDKFFMMFVRINKIKQNIPLTISFVCAFILVVDFRRLSTILKLNFLCSLDFELPLISKP